MYATIPIYTYRYHFYLDHHQIICTEPGDPFIDQLASDSDTSDESTHSDTDDELEEDTFVDEFEDESEDRHFW